MGPGDQCYSKHSYSRHLALGSGLSSPSREAVIRYVQLSTEPVQKKHFPSHGLCTLEL